MNITLLGTGSPVPDANRAGPSTLVVGGEAGTQILVDAGRGVVSRLSGAGSLPVFLSGILLTHLHSDHVSDLNDVITSHWVMAPDGTPLSIYGPVGTARFVEKTLDAMASDVGYRVGHHDDLTQGPTLRVTELEPGDEITIGGLRVTTAATDHRPVAPTLAYRVFEGERSVVLAGDGIPCSTLDELLVGAQAYVQTVIRADLVKLVPMARFQDILDYHSTVEQAAITATRTGVETLVLTHYVPAPAPGDELAWASAATA